MTESKHNSSIWISVEGNISSGKTTLISYLKQQAKEGKDFGLTGYDIHFIDEDMAAWGADLFANFYTNPSRWAFTFQFKVIAIRAKQMRDVIAAIKASGRPALVISERSLESSKHIFMKMCCEAGNITNVERNVYDDCYDILADVCHTDLYINCTTPPELCKERYLKRARKGETLDLNYLKNCHRFHDEWLKNKALAEHVVEIDTSEEVSDEVLNRWYNQIVKSIRKPEKTCSFD